MLQIQKKNWWPLATLITFQSRTSWINLTCWILNSSTINNNNTLGNTIPWWATLTNKTINGLPNSHFMANWTKQTTLETNLSTRKRIFRAPRVATLLWSTRSLVHTLDLREMVTTLLSSIWMSLKGSSLVVNSLKEIRPFKESLKRWWEEVESQIKMEEELATNPIRCQWVHNNKRQGNTCKMFMASILLMMVAKIL